MVEPPNGEFGLIPFLFGNIGADGELENDIFDEESKKRLNFLTELGTGVLLDEVITDEEIKPEDNVDDESVSYDVKSPSAEDFWEEKECFNEFSATSPETKCIDDPPSSENDKPSLTPSTVPDYKPESSVPDSKDVKIKKLETPLAAMLPEKYKNVDVREFFPEFRVEKVLRFSRLFGPGKSSVLPKIWRGTKKKKKRNKSEELSEELSRKAGWTFNYATPPSSPSRVLTDEEELFLKHVENKDGDEQKQKLGTNETEPKLTDWRFGPAQFWYDMLNVSEIGDDFDYGFKTKEVPKKETKLDEHVVPDESFLMVAQVTWEDDIIWDDSEETKQKVMQNIHNKTNAAGWLPSERNRTAQAFSQPGKNVLPSLPGAMRLGAKQTNPATKSTNKSHSKQNCIDEDVDDTWYSIFPVENEELIYSTWEDEIIWDPESVPQIPKPKILTLDPNDENIILGIPPDVDPQKQRADEVIPTKVKIPHPHVKKSKLLLGKAGVINVLQEDAPPPPSKSPSHDPFNISNDSYYLPRSEASLKTKIGGGNLIQHSTPVVELRAPFVHTLMGPIRLRNFHRPPLKRFSHGALAHPGPHSVNALTKYVKQKAKMREQERIASGGGDMFFMRTPEDLTGRDGELILVEFCEEHPPLINQVGMCSKIKNYYKRKASKDQGPTHYRYGEIAYAHTSPFLGVLLPGKSMQVVENNMYRAPIYEHKTPQTDFLVIRTRHRYFIREVDAIFTAGQLCPLTEVPGPNSKRASNFVRDFLQVFIYRLFWRSKDTPKRIRMDEIRKAFPSHSESSIRKRLKQCADFKRTGLDSNWWVIRPDFRLPPEEEIRATVSPEQVCEYFSMLAAEQRLKDAGYGEKFIFATPEDDDEDLQLKMDDEIKVAPWNTTRAYCQARRQKCLLQLTGPADPTGCGEGFSYVRMPNKPMAKPSKEEEEKQPKRIVTGTDADLRKLHLEKAKQLLRDFGVPEEEIKKLTRWEVIDVVRTLSTEKAKAGEQGMTKFSRGNRFSIAEHQERYKEECQRIFDLQNRVLSSAEVLSTDEGESSDEEDGYVIEEMGKNIENMLANKKTSFQLSLEREEQERQELRRMMLSGNDEKKIKDKKKDEDEYTHNDPNQSGRVLRIYRTFKDTEGKEYTRMEVVRKQAVIDAYIKIRTTKDEGFIKQFADVDDAQKEEMKREKRRIQEQLRRIKRNQEKERAGLLKGLKVSTSPVVKAPTGLQTVKRSNEHLKSQEDEEAATATTPAPRKSRPAKIKPDLKMKCGACGATGHMRTNRACPQYNLNAPPPPVIVALTQEQEDEISKQLKNVDNLTNVDGTKVKISSTVLKHAEDIKRRSLQLKIPKDSLSRKRRKQNNEQLDYLKKRQKPANRRRIDPLVELCSVLESILNEMRAQPDVQPFMFPVNAKNVHDYYNIVTRPMDLQTMRENVRQKKYQTREDFLGDVNQIVKNSTLYNGAKSQLTMAAENMLKVCIDLLAKNEDKLMKLEKMINPLLDDDDQVALSFIFTNIVNKMKTMQESWAFVKPVNRKMVKDYYDIVEHPMDFETISNNVKTHKYHSCKEFLDDIILIRDNCIKYNGEDSSYSKRAAKLLETATTSLNEYGEHVLVLEHKIKMVQEKAGIESQSWFSEEYETNEKSSNSLSYSRSATEMGDGMDLNADPIHFVKVETQQLLADDLNCSSDDEMMEEVKEEHNESPTVDHNQTQAAAEAMVQLGNLACYTQDNAAIEMVTDTNFESELVANRVTEAKSFENDFLLCEEEMQGNRHYQELITNVPDQIPEIVQNDLDISDSDDETTERNIDIPEKVTSTMMTENEDDDPDGLWF